MIFAVQHACKGQKKRPELRIIIESSSTSLLIFYFLFFCGSCIYVLFTSIPAAINDSWPILQCLFESLLSTIGSLII